MRTIWPYVLVLVDALAITTAGMLLWLWRAQRMWYPLTFAAIVLVAAALTTTLTLSGYHSNLILGLPMIAMVVGSVGYIIVNGHGFISTDSSGAARRAARQAMMAMLGFLLVFVVGWLVVVIVTHP